MNLAIDAGGTNLRAEIWDNNLHVKSLNSKTDEVGLADWVDFIVHSHPNIRSVGIAYAGQVEDGYIISSPNINIDIKYIKNYIESRHKVSLKIENDLTCAVLAEAKIHSSTNITALYIGTGIGLGVIDSGRVVRGSHNIATEIGHIPYREAPFICGCGRSNCLELFVSGSGIQKWIDYYKLTCKPTLKELKKCSDKRIIDMFEKALLHACGVAITLYNPEILVLGGGIISSNRYLEDMINENIHQYALLQALENVKIHLSTLDDAPLKGALLLKDCHD